MTKVRIEDLKVFRAVADVIGEARAKCELFKLQGCKCIFSDKASVIESFNWRKTPQGHSFWRSIYTGRNPYAK